MTTTKSATQLRAENKELADQLAAATARADLAERYLLHADGFTLRLPNPRALIRVQANGFAHWAVFLNEPDRAGAWDGTGWGPTTAEYDQLYRWTQAEAMAAALAKADEAWADHDTWLAGREEKATAEVENLAEFAGEVA